ncbi:VanZ family protein [Comamonas endophytica]|uniref:VanZ family protein n=1 Tax=Comamonas endophytica TaxID=2949090 RepID=A0ABY6G9E0_9BURK|nr:MULTISPECIES: VanZ family protein [unclassified Acidovorax]MCD2514053.1 VanZ family protein [Acidovorax sp. D4N7]UYG51197.1 VanZ family protein [Acidovorax sp. 5MLIR]
MQPLVSAPSLSSLSSAHVCAWLWRLAAFGWAIAMAWGCLQEAGGGAPGWWRLPHIDKLAHAGMHGMLAWLLWRSRPATSKPLRMAGRIVLLCAAYGLCIEAGQALFTLTRSAELLDALANTAGALIGVALAARLARPASPREGLAGA